MTKNKRLIKLQSFVRKDMYSEILHLLNGVWYLNETCEYKVLAVDLDGALQVKFDIPIHVSRIHTPKSSDSEHVECTVKVTALQLAIIAQSSESIRAIMEYMLRRKTRSGENRQEEEIMDSLILALAEKVELLLPPDEPGLFKKEHISLRGMNAFHLAAKYHPGAIEVMHQIAKDGIMEIFTEKSLPETKVTINGIKEGNSKSKVLIRHIGRKIECIDSEDNECGNGKDSRYSDANVFDEDELAKINDVSKMITEEIFDHHDPFFALKNQKDSFRKCLIKLQILLARRNWLRETPLQVAVQGDTEHDTSAVK
jgi:hypothetical protein